MREGTDLGMLLRWALDLPPGAILPPPHVVRSAVEGPILQRITAFVARWPWAEQGPAHCVLGDFNLADSHIHAALADLARGDLDLETTVAVRTLLQELLAIPEHERYAEADAYFNDPVYGPPGYPDAFYAAAE